MCGCTVSGLLHSPPHVTTVGPRGRTWTPAIVCWRDCATSVASVEDAAPAPPQLTRMDTRVEVEFGKLVLSNSEACKLVLLKVE